MSGDDDFGARMKTYEVVETGRVLDPSLPIYARIDGRAFSSFTRDMGRPFDTCMTQSMIDTAKGLVGSTHASIGYTQSDEISLVWSLDAAESQPFFGGKVYKLTSVLASLATAYFNRAVARNFGLEADIYLDRLPHFDARVFNLPSRVEASNTFLWRAMDARKNAVSMAARSRFSAKKLHGVDQAGMLAMLQEIGVEFERDFPRTFREGIFVRRVVSWRTLTDEELARIPEQHRPIGPVERSSVEAIRMPPFNKVTNRVAVIFDGAKPVEHEEMVGVTGIEPVAFPV